MILVAGLAVVGLVGIAAAFYLSMRPGGSRVRPVPASAPGRDRDRRPSAGRTRASQPPSGRADRPAGPARSARSARSAEDAGSARSRDGRGVDRTGSSPGSSSVIDFTGPQPALEDPEPLVTGRRARHGDRRDDATDEPGPARRIAARRSHEAEPSQTEDATPKSRRRVGFRKGSDVDEELWPAEAFGGVSDEQFWDDLASDKPLATTARSAQPEGAAKRRPPNSGPLPDLYPADDRGRGDGAGGRGQEPPGHGRGGRGDAATGAGTHPQPRLAPDDRTAIQPVLASHQQAEPRGRSRASISADEDPLTSPAYSLRPKGSVDGRSYPSSRRSGDPGRGQYEASPQYDRLARSGNGRGRPDGYRSDPQRSDPVRPDPVRPDPARSDPLRSGDPYGGTGPHAPYPYPQQSYGEPAQSMNTPPYGERYGYGSPAGQAGQAGQAGPAAPGGDTRRANGGRGSSPADVNGAGNGSRGSRPAYPPVNGHRGPYDPRGYDRRLSPLC
jgi:hypothetical protein